MDLSLGRDVVVTWGDYTRGMKFLFWRTAGLSAVVWVAGVAAAQAVEPASVETTRMVLGKLVETQQIVARERKDWQQGKEILQSRLELVQKEIAQLEEKLTSVSAGVKEAEEKKAALLAENDDLKQSATALTQVIGGLETEVRKITKQLPDPLRERIQPLSNRMPEEGKPTKVSLAERFQNVLGILNEVAKMHTEITLATEVRALSDGKPSEVRTVYVGLAQAYFISGRGEAGIGRPGAAGWDWSPANDQARAINQVIEILSNKGQPKFVPLPVNIQ